LTLGLREIRASSARIQQLLQLRHGDTFCRPSPFRARLVFRVHEMLWVNGSYTFQALGLQPSMDAASAHDLGWSIST
jgi:hypothetical protein